VSVRAAAGAGALGALPLVLRALPFVLLVCGVADAAPADPFQWLEDGDAPEVQRWTEGQNAAARRFLDAVPGRAALERRFWQLYEIGSLGVPVSRPQGKGKGESKGKNRRYFYTRRDGKQNQPVLYLRESREGVDRPLVDVNRELADGTRALDWWFPSDDGALVAYGVSDDGNEESILRVRDVATGRDLGDEIPRTRACSLAWTPDGRGFYYTRYPTPGEVPRGEEVYHRAVFHHRLGEASAQDRKVFGAGRDRTDWPGVDLSPDGRWLVITVDQGWSKSEVYLLDTQSVAGASQTPIAVATGEEAKFEVVEALDDRLYLFTTSGAPRGRVFRVDPRQPARARWRQVIAESEDVLASVVYFRGGLAASYLHDAAARLRLYDENGTARAEVALAGLGTITSLSGARDADEVFYAFTGFLAPTTIFRVGPGHAPKGIVWRRLEAPIDPTAFEVERAMVTSRDGTRVPLFLAHRKGVPRDGTRPALLTGYGGFDVNMLPGWTPSAIPFLESGGTFALAILRGGGEYGEAWHRAGMLANKQNVFDDFIAAATWLSESRVTSADRLAISGRSNGGLLVGAALTQRPELFRAVVCGVPLLDMLRYHLFRIAALWIPEYGSPDDPEARRWLAAYSPYQHVRDGVKYPAVYLHTAASDSRVDPMHARKMAARLQAAVAAAAGSADAGSNDVGQRPILPILLQVESRAGHGAGKPLAKVITQLVDEWSFLFAELGISYEVRTK
jgi:prolyl oligopeptidase